MKEQDNSCGAKQSSHQHVREVTSSLLSDPVKQEGRLHPAWAVGILLWMWFGLGVYVFKMLILPGRVDRLLALFESLLH